MVAEAAWNILGKDAGQRRSPQELVAASLLMLEVANAGIAA
jgi:hypothetical protein